MSDAKRGGTADPHIPRTVCRECERLRTQFAQLAKVATHADEAVGRARAEVERLRGDLSETRIALANAEWTRIALANAECREGVAEARLAEAERILEIVRVARLEGWYEDNRKWAQIDEYFARAADSAGEKP